MAVIGDEIGKMRIMRIMTTYQFKKNFQTSNNSAQVIIEVNISRDTD